MIQKKKNASTIPQLIAARNKKVTVDFHEPEECSEEEEEEEEEKETNDNNENKNAKKKTSRGALVPGERVTRAQRNKIKRKKEFGMKKREQDKKEKIKKQITNVKKIQNAIVDDEKYSKELQEQRKAKHEIKLNQDPIPVLSTGKKHEHVPFVDVVLPSDLSRTMREMKPHEDFASARFHSYHVRNLIVVPDQEAFRRNKRKRSVKPVLTGKKFVEEDFKLGQKKKRKRFMRNRKVDISL